MKGHGEEAGRSYAQGLQLAFAAGAAEFLNTLRETIDQASEYASKLATTSMITGDSPKKLQELEYAFRGVGVSAEQMQRQMAMLQDRVIAAGAHANDTTSVFYRLGLSAKAMASNTASENLDLIANKLRNLKTSAEQTAAAALVFGARLGPQMLPVLLQGSEGIDKLGNSAVAAGAVIDQALVEKLEALDSKIHQLQQTTQTFYVTIGGPVIDALMKFTDAVARVQAEFEKLSDQSKLLLLIGSLAASFLAFEKGLETVGYFMRGMISKELFDFLVDLAGPLRIIIAVVTILATAWVTNFGNIKNSAATLWSALQQFFSQAQAAFRELSDYVATTLAPAIQNLSKSFQPLLVTISAIIQTVIQSNIIWGTFVEIAKLLIVIITNLVGAIGILVDIVSEIAAGFYDFGLTAVEAFANIDHAIATAEFSLGRFLDKLADASKAVPAVSQFFRGAANGARAGATVDEGQARQADRFAAQMRRDREEQNREHEKQKRDRNERPHGTADLAQPQTKPKDTSGGELSDLKDQAQPLEEAIRRVEVELSHLNAEYANLGKIDSAEKVARAQGILTDQIAAHNREATLQVELAQKWMDIKRQTESLGRGATNDADRRKFRSAADEDQKNADSAREKAYKDQADRSKLEAQRAQIPVTFQTDIAADPLKSDAQRGAALANAAALLSIQKESLSRDQAMAKVDADRIALNSKITEEMAKQRDLARTHQEDQIQGGIAQRDAQVFSGPNAAADEQARKEADAADEVQIAKLKEIQATDEVAVALNELAFATKNGATPDQMKAAADKVTTAQNAAAVATNAVTVAQQRLLSEQQATSPAVEDVRQKLMALAQQVAGPLVQAFKDIQAGTNPLVALFLNLVSQTRSFQDIMNVFAEVMRVVAAIFDALRPVIDLFLGILIGVVNVFIALYNIVGSILAIFGVQLVKLQALTDSLTGLDDTVKPLVQVVHDLPTINQYNAGQTGDLSIPQQNTPLVPAIENNTQSLVQLGQTLGTLIAVFVGANIVSNLGGFFQGLQSIGNDIANFWNNLTSQWSSGMKTGVDDFLTGIGEIYAGLDLINNHTGGILGFLEKLVGYMSVFEGAVNVVNGVSNMLGGGNLINGIPGQGGLMGLLGGGSAPGSVNYAANNTTDNYNVPNNVGSLLDPGQSLPVTVTQLPEGFDTNLPTSLLDSTSSVTIPGLTSLNNQIPQLGTTLGTVNAASGELSSNLDLSTSAMSNLGITTADLSGNISTMTPLTSDLTNAMNTGVGATTANTSGLSSLTTGLSGLGATLTKVLGGAGEGAGIGSLLAGITGGNATNSSLFGAIGGGLGSTLSIAGTAMGPLGTIAGSVLGSLIGGLIGPKYNATTNPDMFNSQTNYTQIRDDVMGGTTMDATTSSETGGIGEAKLIADYIQQTGGTGLSAGEISEFQGDTSATVMSLHQGDWTMANGVTASWSQIASDAATAINQIATTLNGANMNLNSTFGNGSTVTTGGTATRTTQATSDTAQVVVNIGTLNGDAGNTTETLTQVMNDAYAQFAQNQLQAIRSNTFTYSQFT